MNESIFAWTVVLFFFFSFLFVQFQQREEHHLYALISTAGNVVTVSTSTPIYFTSTYSNNSALYENFKSLFFIMQIYVIFWMKRVLLDSKEVKLPCT